MNEVMMRLGRTFGMPLERWTSWQPSRKLPLIMKGKLAHRLVALSAAYAMALYALLPAVAAMAARVDGEASFGIICLAGAFGSAPDHGAPFKQQPSCPCPGSCAMPGCVIALADCAGRTVAQVFGPSMESVPFSGGDAARQQAPRSAGGNLARAPPLA